MRVGQSHVGAGQVGAISISEVIQPRVEVRPGDVIWCPPKERHWHGATPTTAMTHIAIQEALDGKVVEWMEKVSDEQYRS